MKVSFYIVIFVLIPWFTAGKIFFPDYYLELFWGMLLPLITTACTLYIEKIIYDKSPEKLTPFLIKAFIGKMLVYGLYIIIIFSFYSFNPVPFIISFSACFITLHVIEALFLKSILSK